MSIPLIEPTYTITINNFPITSDVLDADAKIFMNTSFEPDSFKISLYNVDDVVQSFLINGSVVTISLGYTSGLINQIITGVITNIYHNDSQGEKIKIIEGIDQVIYKLKHTPINLSLSTPADVIEIIRQIASQAGVILSPVSIPSGIILQNYTIDQGNAYKEIEKLAKRIEYNVTSKSSMLYVTSTINNNLMSGLISEEIGFKLTEVKASTQNGKYRATGYNFFGCGVPTLIPMGLVSVSMTEDQIFGVYILESVTHDFECKRGYLCSGTMIETTASYQIKHSIQSATMKSLASIVSEKIKEEIAYQKTLETGIIEQVFESERTATAKIGLIPEENKSITTPSHESDNIGKNNVMIVKKPLISNFAGNGYGLITPVYREDRSVIAYNKFDAQDSNILGFIFKKGNTIPDHDAGDYMLHHKNHSKSVMKESGHQIFQVKGLKIEVGSNALTPAKPTATDDGKFTLVFDDSSELSYKQGEGWKLKTSGNVEIEGAGIKLGSGASQGGARMNDQITSDISSDSAFWIWLSGLSTALTAWVPTIDPMDVTLKLAITALGPFPSSLKGKITQASSKTKIE